MATRIKYDLDLGPFYKYIRQVLRRSQNFSGVFRAAMKDLERAHARNFDSKGALVGGWQPKDSEYAGWKLQEYGEGGVLVRTGTLKRSLTVSNARGAIRDIGRRQAEFGTSIGYAHFHQSGTDDMNSRKIVFVPNRFVEGLADDALKYLAYGESPLGAMKRAANIGRR